MEIEVNDLLSLSEKQIDYAEKAVHIFADRFSITNDFVKCKEYLNDDLKKTLGNFYYKYLYSLDYLSPNKNGKMILKVILHKARLAKLLYEK